MGKLGAVARAGLIKEYRKLLTCLALFLAFLLILLFRSGFSQIDSRVSLWVPSIQSVNFTGIALAISDAFEIHVLLMVTAALAALLFFKHRKEEGLLLLGAMGGVAAVTEAVKVLIRSPRPLNGLTVESGFSFPSGHVSGITVFCGILAFIAWQRWRSDRSRRLIIALAVGVASLVGLDRIYLNVHWFSDVLGGYVLGTFWVSLSILVYDVLRRKGALRSKISG